MIFAKLTNIMPPQTGSWNKITKRELDFVDNYRLTGNITQAYIDAGYKVKSRQAASVCGSKLLKTVKVQQVLTIPTRAKDMTIDRIQEELGRIAWSEPRNELSCQQKLRALELLGKSLGMFRKEKKHQELTTVQILQITKECEEENARQ